MRRKFTRTLVASFADKSIPQVLTGSSIDTGDAVAQAISPSGKLTVVLMSVSGEKKKHYIEVRKSPRDHEAACVFVLRVLSHSRQLTRTLSRQCQIWSQGSILHILETTAIHDDFYADATFGTLEWSRDETRIVYVAERKKTEDVLEVK